MLPQDLHLRCAEPGRDVHPPPYPILRPLRPILGKGLLLALSGGLLDPRGRGSWLHWWQSPRFPSGTNLSSLWEGTRISEWGQREDHGSLRSPDPDQMHLPLFPYPCHQEFWALGPDLGSNSCSATQLSKSLYLLEFRCPVLN